METSFRKKKKKHTKLNNKKMERHWCTLMFVVLWYKYMFIKICHRFNIIETDRMTRVFTLIYVEWEKRSRKLSAKRLSLSLSFSFSLIFYLFMVNSSAKFTILKFHIELYLAISSVRCIDMYGVMHFTRLRAERFISRSRYKSNMGKHSVRFFFLPTPKRGKNLPHLKLFHWHFRTNSPNLFHHHFSPPFTPPPPVSNMTFARDSQSVLFRFISI